MASRPHRRRPVPSRRFLPSDPRVAEPYRLTPQLALRVGILGALALGVFAILFLRLWSLQVLSGDRYLAAAQDNQLRTMRVEAPRGPILDREGRVVVSNVAGTAVKLWVSDLPTAGRYAMLGRLAKILRVPRARLAREVDRAIAEDPLTPITVKTAVHQEQILYLKERQSEFPGLQIEETYLRDYEYRALAAQVLGYVGEISQEELDAREGGAYRAGDKIGKTGVERAYDRYLRGRAGTAQVRVDSLGRPQSRPQIRQEARPGYGLRLTIDVELQRAAERALIYGIQLARNDDQWNANGGAIVAMDPRNGEILAMASNPTYKPSIYVGRVDPKKLEPLVDPEVARERNYPGINRAIAGVYPPGSTFKPITALAAMEEGVVSAYESLPCTPTYTAGLDEHEFANWNPYTNEAMALATALAESCDTYFYALGDEFYKRGETEGLHWWSSIQGWAARFGFGKRTGLDIGGEAEGLLPTPAWRKRTYSNPIDKAWNPGELIQLAIGQKDITVTPLQMTRFYALVANGGKLVTPHLVTSVEQPGANGAPAATLRTFAPPPPQQLQLDADGLAAVRDGLYRATHDPDGTSSGVFGSFPIPVAGKTGTAEKVVPLPGYPPGHMEDQAWWCGYGPTDDPEIVVCALIENGGHGGTAAAPAALRVFEQWFGVRAGRQTVVATD